MTPFSIPIHVGSEPPASWDDIEAKQQELGGEASRWLRDKRRPTVASPILVWDALGFEPRWVGFDTAACVVALQPSIFSGQGADEFNRFRQGAESRSELALVISPIETVDNNPRSVFTPHGGSVHLGKFDSTIASRPLGPGAKVRAATDLSDADRDLALRLINCNQPLSWASLTLHGVSSVTYDGPQKPPQGTLEPIVETELGEPVIAVWTSPDHVERRYVVPAETPWPLLLQWLLEHALPAYVPNAIRRARRSLPNDHAVMTRRERVAHQALTDFEANYVAGRAGLKREIEEARAAAETVRDGLLYGTGSELVGAVRAVVETAGIEVVDLDVQLGGTKNADLLCTYASRSRLVEVKSASGNAPERAYEDLVRHLREWTNLPGGTPIEGGALVLNHQHRMPPHDRSPKPYWRPEFLAAQMEPVITALDLFAAWREEDWDNVRALVFGEFAGQTPFSDNGDVVPTERSALRKQGGGRRGWLRRR